MKQKKERRLAENEVIFRQINKDADDFLHDVGVQHVVSVHFFCEYSDMQCRERIELMPTEYERIHKHPRYFVLVHGHENFEIEKVVELHEFYVIVEKFRALPKPEEVAHRLNELQELQE